MNKMPIWIIPFVIIAGTFILLISLISIGLKADKKRLEEMNLQSQEYYKQQIEIYAQNQRQKDIETKGGFVPYDNMNDKVLDLEGYLFYKQNDKFYFKDKP